MDLIERQAAIDAPEEFIKDCNPEHFVGYQKFIEFMDNAEIGSFGNWQFANGFNMGLTAAEVAIKKLPSAPRWIPVTERLPKPVAPSQRREWFITSSTYGGVTVTCYEFEASPFKEGWQTDMTVLAWMPLPEPWKGEEDD